MRIFSLRNIAWSIAKIISNLNFSIFLLLLIAFISVLGTIIEQDQALSYYQTNYPSENVFLSFFDWKAIIYLGFDHVYVTWWFLSILFLFFLSLIICTFSRQLPSLNNARNWKFLQQTKKIKKLSNFQSFYYKSLSNMVYSLHTRDYYVFHKGSSIYAYKGLLGRIAPIFVHMSIIMTLIGAVIGIFGGFIVQEMVPSGEAFHVNNVIKSGFSSRLPKNLLGFVKDFHIEYNADSSTKQFFSSISLLNNEGDNLITQQISVNSPLIFNGVTFYQTDWQMNALRFQIGNAQIMQKKINQVKLGNKSFWVCTLPVSLNKQINIVIISLQDKLLIYNSEGQLVNACALNDMVQIYDNSLIIKEIMTSTGLQIKADPGVPIVYGGFFLLMISIAISYVSYSQVWVKSLDSAVELAGSTNRAALTFEEDFIAIQKVYTLYTFKNLIT